MNHRPFPNAARALRNLRHQQAVYMYGRVPQRYVLGLDAATAPHPHFVMDGRTGAIAPWTDDYPVDEYRLSSRPGVVSGGQ